MGSGSGLWGKPGGFRILPMGRRDATCYETPIRAQKKRNPGRNRGAELKKQDLFFTRRTLKEAIRKAEMKMKKQT